MNPVVDIRLNKNVSTNISQKKVNSNKGYYSGTVIIDDENNSSKKQNPETVKKLEEVKKSNKKSIYNQTNGSGGRNNLGYFSGSAFDFDAEDSFNLYLYYSFDVTSYSFVQFDFGFLQCPQYFSNYVLYDDVLFIGLTMDREILYDIINKRVDVMINNGLLDEVKSFYDKNMRYKPLLGGIGYKELFSYYDGDVSLEVAIDLIKRNSRRYAKRQYTFFNNQFKIKWFMVDIDNFDKTINDVCGYING